VKEREKTNKPPNNYVKIKGINNREEVIALGISTCLELILDVTP